MSGVGPDRRSGYKLIPQSNSDNSELSDEELHSLYKDGFQIIAKNRVYSSEQFTGKQKTIESRTYSSLMSSEKVDVKANHVFPAYRQECTFRETNTMSVKRKFSFGFSIFLCLFTTGLFLILPCEWANCSCNLKKNATRETWQNIISNIELRGPVFLVHTLDWHDLNFILMARGSIFADAPVIRTNYTPSSGGDMLAFDGSKDGPIWRKHFNKMPNEVDCSLFSIHNRLPKDCIIVSYGNYITVISSENGRSFWSLPFNTKHKMKEMFPLVVPDMNKDKVLDLMVVTDLNKIVLISGLSGTILNSDFSSRSQNCTEIKYLRMCNESTLEISCEIENNVTEINLSLKGYMNSDVANTEVIPQHYSFPSLNWMYVHNYSIKVVNEGSICPKKCKTKIVIRNSNKTTVWSHQSDYSYGLAPVAFDMNYTIGMYGFIFKIWELEHEDTETKKLKMRHNDVKLNVSFLYERTVIVVFNSSLDEPFQTINMSYNPIIQLYNIDKSIQPDPISQQHSLIVADVTTNGTLQIITYYSTFEDNKRDNYTYSDYTLKSYIRMYDLETEIVRNLNVKH